MRNTSHRCSSSHSWLSRCAGHAAVYVLSYSVCVRYSVLRMRIRQLDMERLNMLTKLRSTILYTMRFTCQLVGASVGVLETVFVKRASTQVRMINI